MPESAVCRSKEDAQYFVANGCVYSRNPQKLIYVPEIGCSLSIIDGTTGIAMCADGILDVTDAAIILTYTTAIGSGNPDAKLEDFL